MMPTLRDRMLQRQWQQETEAATLSLAEIAERWARLECGDDPDEELVNDYLREIASHLSERQQRQQRLERSVMPTLGVPAYVPHPHVIDPWQSLHKMRYELRAAAAGNREAAAKLRFTDAMLRICLSGSPNQPPAGLFPALAAPQPQVSQAKIDDTDQNLPLTGVEPECEQADPDPSSPSATRLRTEHGRVNAHLAEPEPAMPACAVENSKTPQQRGAHIANEPYRMSEEFCIEMATRMWKEDEQEAEDSRIDKKRMLYLLQHALGDNGMRQPTDDVLWKWLKRAGIVPIYASRRGRKARYLD